jgi:TetR/AcrR family transcriptional repressor of nem operon
MKRTNAPDALRRKVLDAAAELFPNQGYTLTSLQNIAARAGVTQGAMHHHFPNKKAIGLAVIRERVRPALEAAWLSPVSNAASAAEGIAAAFRAICADLDAHQAVQGCPVNNLAAELSLADADFRSEFRRLFDEWRARIASKLRSDLADGTLNGVDPNAFATVVVAAYSGAMAMAKADQATDALKICARHLVDDLTAR